uniref:Uncharacterized protein n=1 Tax=Anopheles atroparvus TaxID=41427 RepID=A0AAG5D805_ANOAO
EKKKNRLLPYTLRSTTIQSFLGFFFFFFVGFEETNTRSFAKAQGDIKTGHHTTARHQEQFAVNLSTDSALDALLQQDCSCGQHACRPASCRRNLNCIHHLHSPTRSKPSLATAVDV